MAGGGQIRPQGGGQVGSLSGQPPLMRRGGTEPQFQAGFGARPSPLAPQGNFNVNQAAAGGLQQAMQGTQQAMNFALGEIATLV